MLVQHDRGRRVVRHDHQLAELHAGAEHRHALVEISLSKSEAGCLKQIHQRRGTKDGPILTELNKPRQIGQFCIHAHPRQAQRRLRGPVGADVAIVDIGEVPFEIEFQLASERDVRHRIEPLEVNSRAEGAIFDVELRITVWSSVAEQ